MKIKTISRTQEDYVRQSKLDITKVHHNRDPTIHPFERAREYSKAIVSSKLDKIFAKPFVGALQGHMDSVYCTSTVRNSVVSFISGACDGEVKVWDLARKATVWSANAHQGFVRGISPDQTGTSFFTCGDDKLIKKWVLAGTNESTVEPVKTFTAPHLLTAIDHHRVDNQFATSGDTVCVWNSDRDEPLHSYKWGSDTVLSVSFNPAETSLLGSTCADRMVCLYDLRAASPIRKFALSMRSNKLAWNPREPFNFVLANEDANVYQFDMRKLDKALMIHKDHVSAVMDVAFSPTGREFATGGYDRTLRLFNTNGPRSREVYHTKRMQRIFSVNFSTDAKFVLTGSDDTNIRLWKAKASESLGVNPGRQERKQQLNNAVKKRYSHMPEVKRISKHKLEPKYIKKAASIAHIQNDSQRKKQDNRKRHSSSDDANLQPLRKRAVLREYE
mmetsp:Transcript_2548/g.4635  ORF Transcript_2548/g.4635 Transcript_2548/m.4635 type:complete len:445 (-) Transcript_2548:154-1488(-)